METFEQIELPIEMNIWSTSRTTPSLGYYAELGNEGLKLDRTLVISSVQEAFSYNTYTGSLTNKLREGTKISDWNSGILEGLAFKQLDLSYKPIIKTGNYTFSSSVRSLYSDFSYTSYISPLNDVDDNHTLQLPDDIIKDTVRIYRLMRDSSLHTLIVDEWDETTEEFKDDRSREYSIDDDLLLTIKDTHIRKHGINPDELDYDTILEWGIFVGNGNGSTHDFFLRYFPVVPDTFRGFVLNSEDSTVEEWEATDSFDFALEDDKVFVLDADLGVVSTGGYKPDDLVLFKAITSSDVEIQYYMNVDNSSYPTKGIVHIGDETIAYTDRSHDKLLNCTRGYLGTEAVSHAIGDIIEYERRGLLLPEDSSLYVYYESTLRIDGEVSTSNLRTGNEDCRPSKNSSASQIVQISSKITDLDRLVLVSDKTRLGSNRYGPLYFGSDSTKLTVTAYDSRNNPVDDLEITIEIVRPPVGLLDGEADEVSKISDSDGQIHAYYNAPIDSDTFTTKFSGTTYVGSSTVFEIEDIDKYASVDDIWLFQIFKYDPAFGTIGLKYEIETYQPVSSRPDTNFYVIIKSAALDDSYNNGTALFISENGLVQTRVIEQAYGDRIYCSGGDLTEDPVDVYIFTESDIVWNPQTLNGVPVIVYIWDDESKHPLTGAEGAYTPLRPSSISNGLITYSHVLPEPDSSARGTNLGGYLIVAPVVVQLRAYAFDPYSGEKIYSNFIYLTLKAPSYMTGVDTSGTLPIPKGFNLKIDENNIGNGIGLPNFYTINKRGGLFGLQLRLKP